MTALVALEFQTSGKNQTIKSPPSPSQFRMLNPTGAIKVLTRIRQASPRFSTQCYQESGEILKIIGHMGWRGGGLNVSIHLIFCWKYCPCNRHMGGRATMTLLIECSWPFALDLSMVQNATLMLMAAIIELAPNVSVIRQWIRESQNPEAESSGGVPRCHVIVNSLVKFSRILGWIRSIQRLRHIRQLRIEKVSKNPPLQRSVQSNRNGSNPVPSFPVEEAAIFFIVIIEMQFSASRRIALKSKESLKNPSQDKRWSMSSISIRYHIALFDISDEIPDILQPSTWIWTNQFESTFITWTTELNFNSFQWLSLITSSFATNPLVSLITKSNDDQLNHEL